MAESQSDAEQAIRALSDNFARAFNAGDMERMVDAYYAEDAVALPPNAPMATGRQQIRETFRAFQDAGFKDLAMETVKVEASGDLAYRVGRYTSGGPTPDRGKFVDVFKRQADGSWRCVADTMNSDLEAPA